MLSINGKKFMNLPEAVQWLLDNNALSFQSTASFAPDTEIAKSTIINPAPAEIKIGSLVLFADGKVGTVSAITTNGFKVGNEATDLSDGVPHIVDLKINASGHLIATMSEGDPIDAGLIKMLSGLSIDGSQHLIASYNDGSTTDLGAIFQGNVNIAGNLTADSIIENMSGYSFVKATSANFTFEYIYAGIVKNGNKVTFALAMNITKDSAYSSSLSLGYFVVPAAVGNKIYPTTVNIGGTNYSVADTKVVKGFGTTPTDVNLFTQKNNPTDLQIIAQGSSVGNIPEGVKLFLRYEVTFLLSNNLAS